MTHGSECADVPSVKLSVIIPTRDRCGDVVALLDSLAACESAGDDWEVLVVDNGSRDETVSATRSRQPLFPALLRVLEEPNPGLHAGRNRGALEARGEYLCYLDDDVLVSPGWLAAWRRLASERVEAAVGRILPLWETECPEWIQSFFVDGCLGYLTLLDKGRTRHRVDPRLIWGANFMIRRDRVLALGGFPPDAVPPALLKYRGDGETGLMGEFERRRWSTWYEPAAEVLHRVPAARMTVQYFCDRAYRQGISDSYREIRDRLRWLVADPGNSIASALQRSIWLAWRIGHAFAWRLHRERPENEQPMVSAPVFESSSIDPVQSIRVAIERRRREGYRWHRSEVLRKYELLQWILIRDYMNDGDMRPFVDKGGAE